MRECECDRKLLPLQRRLCFRRCLSVCLSVCLFVCLLPTLRRNVRTDLHEIFREGWQWAIEQMITFWWRSGSGIPIRIRIRIRIWIRIRIATLVRRALAEVSTVRALLVHLCSRVNYCWLFAIQGSAAIFHAQFAHLRADVLFHTRLAGALS